jgi:hypothetical protein
MPALFLSECWRVLRPSGVLHLTTPNVVDLRGRTRALLGQSPQSHLFGIERTLRMNEWVHRREYAPAEVARLVQAVGFRVSGLHTWMPSRAEGGQGAGGWLAPLLNRMPGLGGTIFVAATRPAVAASETDRARIVPGCRYLEAMPGSNAALTVRVTNIGTATWDPGSVRGAVALGAHLAEPDGRVLDRELARASLLHSVSPGQETVVTLSFRAPHDVGVFLLELDLVREGEHWFADDGSPPARVVLRIGS